MIYHEVDDKDWLNPSVMDKVEAKFIEKAQQKWSAEDKQWAIDGGWLTNRDDIVSWMRSIYWKHNKKRLSGTFPSHPLKHLLVDQCRKPPSPAPRGKAIN